MKLSNMLNSALVFSANKDVRYYLNGVNIYYKGSFIGAIASTNGHCIQLLTNNIDPYCDLSKFKSMIISNNDCKRLSNIFQSDGVDEVTIEDILKHATPIDVCYPDVRRVIPTSDGYDGELEIGIDYKYLAKISQSMTKLGKGVKLKLNGAKFTFKGASKATKVEVSQPAFDGVKALIVIMPMKI